jgi:predicted dehydrogenase
MRRYRACLVGCGPRGAFHTEGFIGNPDRFDLTAVCDLNEERLKAFAARFGIAKAYRDAEEMLSAERPEVFCFATLPDVRLSLVDLGVRHGVKAIAFEKPMAQDLSEARAILDIANRHDVRLIISHQQKYGPHWAKVKAIVDGGDIGTIEKIHATARSWLSQLGTHLIDYMIWFNGGERIDWVDGLSHGTAMLSDSHPSPDVTFGQLKFRNGVRGIIECGALAPHNIPGDAPFRSQGFWFDNSVTIYGTHGYARVVTGGGWRAFTRYSGGEVLSGDGTFNPSYEQPLYLRDLADWLDDPKRVHPCNGDVTYHGFEASMALYVSALERRKVDLPLNVLPEGSLIERLRAELPDQKEYVVQ